MPHLSWSGKDPWPIGLGRLPKVSGVKRLSPEHKEYLSFMVDLWQFMDHVNGDAKALYCCLATYENRITNKARPCQKTLCRHLGISPNTLRERVEDLEEANLLRKEKIPITSSRFQWEYTLYAPQPKSRSRPSRGRSKGKEILFPSQNSENSIPSTTQEGGNSASTFKSKSGSGIEP